MLIVLHAYGTMVKPIKQEIKEEPMEIILDDVPPKVPKINFGMEKGIYGMGIFVPE